MRIFYPKQDQMPVQGIFEKAKKVRDLFGQVRASVIKIQAPGAFSSVKYTVDAFKVTEEGKEKYAQAMRLIHELHNGGPRGCFLALDILRDEREFFKTVGRLVGGDPLTYREDTTHLPGVVPKSKLENEIEQKLLLRFRRELEGN
jgi:hypothetical protein